MNRTEIYSLFSLTEAQGLPTHLVLPVLNGLLSGKDLCGSSYHSLIKIWYLLGK